MHPNFSKISKNKQGNYRKGLLVPTPLFQKAQVHCWLLVMDEEILYYGTRLYILPAETGARWLLPKATEVIGNCAKQSFAYFVPHHPGLQLEVTPHYVKQAVVAGAGFEPARLRVMSPGWYYFTTPQYLQIRQHLQRPVCLLLLPNCILRAIKTVGGERQKLPSPMK